MPEVAFNFGHGFAFAFAVGYEGGVVVVVVQSSSLGLITGEAEPEDEPELPLAFESLGASGGAVQVGREVQETRDRRSNFHPTTSRFTSRLQDEGQHCRIFAIEAILGVSLRVWLATHPFLSHSLRSAVLSFSLPHYLPDTVP